MPDAPGTYLLTVSADGATRVTYAGMTENLWMVTRGRLPDGRSRPAQRYDSTLKYLGDTRRYVNILAADQMRLGRTMTHSVGPLADPQVDPTLRRGILLREEDRWKRRWRLCQVGWNRK